MRRQRSETNDGIQVHTCVYNVYDLLNFEPGRTDSGAKAQETNESREDVGDHLSGEGTRNDWELTQRPVGGASWTSWG